MLRFSYDAAKEVSIEDLRLALVNYIVAKQRGEEMVVRIEDLHLNQNEQSFEGDLLNLLDFMGIAYREVVYQSNNIKFHSAMAIDLIHRKKAFNCFCDEEREPYDGVCLELPAEEVIDNPKPFRVRAKKPAAPISFVDKVQGKVEFSPQAIDDFVLLDVDKTPTRLFATVIDDMLQDISFVVQNEKDIELSAKELYIFRNLGYDKKIEFASLPPLLNTPSVKTLLENKIAPEILVSYLVAQTSQMPKEIFSLDEAIELFDIEKAHATSQTFDMKKLTTLGDLQ